MVKQSSKMYSMKRNRNLKEKLTEAVTCYTQQYETRGWYQPLLNSNFMILEHIRMRSNKISELLIQGKKRIYKTRMQKMFTLK